MPHFLSSACIPTIQYFGLTEPCVPTVVTLEQDQWLQFSRLGWSCFICTILPYTVHSSSLLLSEAEHLSGSSREWVSTKLPCLVQLSAVNAQPQPVLFLDLNLHGSLCPWGYLKCFSKIHRLSSTSVILAL